MPALKRAQLVIQTVEGDVITSVQYDFDGRVNEYITLKSLQWLMHLDDEQLDAFVASYKLITRLKYGMLWVNCSDVLPLLGWTPH